MKKNLKEVNAPRRPVLTGWPNKSRYDWKHNNKHAVYKDKKLLWWAELCRHAPLAPESHPWVSGMYPLGGAGSGRGGGRSRTQQTAFHATSIYYLHCSQGELVLGIVFCHFVGRNIKLFPKKTKLNIFHATRKVASNIYLLNEIRGGWLKQNIYPCRGQPGLRWAGQLKATASRRPSVVVSWPRLWRSEVPTATAATAACRMVTQWGRCAGGQHDEEHGAAQPGPAAVAPGHRLPQGGLQTVWLW